MAELQHDKRPDEVSLGSVSSKFQSSGVLVSYKLPTGQNKPGDFLGSNKRTLTKLLRWVVLPWGKFCPAGSKLNLEDCYLQVEMCSTTALSQVQQQGHILILLEKHLAAHDCNLQWKVCKQVYSI